MRTSIAALLLTISLQVPGFAISGGPQYPTGSTPLTGTYAGVLLPVSNVPTDALATPVPGEPVVTTPEESSFSSLGLFVIAVPDAGPATGTFLFFLDGEAFYGRIAAVADAARGSIRGLLTGAAVGNNDDTGVEFLEPVSAVGKMEAEVAPIAGFFGAASTRLVGESNIELRGYVPDASPSGFGFAVLSNLTYAIDGFKQADIFGNAEIPPPSTTSVPTPTPRPRP